MKSFRFPLERVLMWRRTQIDLEEQRLKALAAEGQRIEREKAELEQSGAEARQRVQGMKSAAGEDLNALALFLGHVERAGRVLQNRREECRRRQAEQQRRFLEARRAYRVLELLREKRFSEWEYEGNRELEAMVSETYLSQWTQR